MEYNLIDQGLFNITANVLLLFLLIYASQNNKIMYTVCRQTDQWLSWSWT
jgi:hypothetical protein